LQTKSADLPLIRNLFLQHMRSYERIFQFRRLLPGPKSHFYELAEIPRTPGTVVAPYPMTSFRFGRQSADESLLLFGPEVSRFGIIPLIPLRNRNIPWSEIPTALQRLRPGNAQAESVRRRHELLRQA
jgi:hypothetical protein